MMRWLGGSGSLEAIGMTALRKASGLSTYMLDPKGRIETMRILKERLRYRTRVDRVLL
jgi:hypothetical protein